MVSITARLADSLFMRFVFEPICSKMASIATHVDAS